MLEEDSMNFIYLEICYFKDIQDYIFPLYLQNKQMETRPNFSLKRENTF
jgi:hypothetical protein